MKISRGAIAGVCILAGALSACARASAPGEKVQPFYLEPIEGTGLSRVVLTQKAAERLDIQTTLVREEQVVRTWRVGGVIVASADTATTDTTSVWARVLLDQSELDKVDRRNPVRIVALGGDDEEDSNDEAEELFAEPDEGPGEDDAEQGPQGLFYYYLIDNAEAGLAQGQGVLVELSQAGGAAARKVIPFAAVIYEPDGSTWVYTNPEPLVFIRQPIDIDYIEGDLAILLDGPGLGMAVVTIGAAELFGAETGVSK